MSLKIQNRISLWASFGKKGIAEDFRFQEVLKGIHFFPPGGVKSAPVSG